MESYDYLASPYTDPDPLVREMRYLRVLEVTSILLKNGIFVYSPIVHCHHMSQVFSLPTDAEWWKAYDSCMIRNCRALQVLRLEGWARSVGVRGEIELAAKLGKTITYISGDLNAAAAVTINPDRKEPPAE